MLNFNGNLSTMKKTFILPLTGIAMWMITGSCGDPAPVDPEKKTERIPVELSEDDIFKGNLVMAFLENDEKFIQEANELFLKGINSFRNEKNLDSADFYLRQSILKEPSAKAYFELGNVYMDKRKFDDAMMAYGLAEQLDYEPVSKIMYNKSCAYSLQKKPELAGKYLEYALQAGYTNLDHINKDEDLNELRETYYYKQAIEKGLRGMSDADNLFWLQFKKQFAVMDMPIKLKMEIDPEELQGLKYISYEYEKYISEMRDQEFSREVSKSFLYYARPYETEDFVAVVYIVKDEFMGDYAPLTYRMATFTHEGKLIDKMEIGGRSDYGEPVKVATIRKDRVIDVKLIEPEYENEPSQYGYYENPMVSSKTVGTMKIRVTSSGKIKAEEVKDIAAN